MALDFLAGCAGGKEAGGSRPERPISGGRSQACGMGGRLTCEPWAPAAHLVAGVSSPAEWGITMLWSHWVLVGVN